MHLLLPSGITLALHQRDDGGGGGGGGNESRRFRGWLYSATAISTRKYQNPKILVLKPPAVSHCKLADISSVNTNLYGLNNSNSEN